MIRLLLSVAFNRDLDSESHYVRCGRCGTTASDLEGAPLLTSIHFITSAHLIKDDQMPPEWSCPACGRTGPLEAGELLDNDTLIRCRRTLICRYAWTVPASLTTVTCPRCYTTQPGPAAQKTRE